MSEVNMSRRYNAPRRAEQAAATREAIITAASTLFARDGYSATTVAAIAAEARVTPKSVYSLADKPQLLLLAVDRAIVGDDEPVALIDRAEMREILDARDLRSQARLVARLSVTTLKRLYPIYRAFEHAAASDPAISAAWQESQRARRTDVRAVVKSIDAAGGLREGLSVDRATDTLWALVGWHPFALLVEERGWSDEQLTRWLEDVYVSLLGRPDSD